MLTKTITRRTPTTAAAPSRAALAAQRLSGANDNRRIQNSAPRVAINPRRLARFGRIILNASLPLRLASNAIDFYEIISGGGSPEWQAQGNWFEYARCANPDFRYTASTMVLAHSSLPSSRSIRNLSNSCSAGFTPQGPSEPSEMSPSSDSFAVGGLREIPGTGSTRGQAWVSFTRPNNSNPDPWPKLVSPAPVFITPALPNQWVGSADPGLLPMNMGMPFPPPVPLALNPEWKAPNRTVSNGAAPLPTGTVANNWSRSITISSKGIPVLKPAPKTHVLRPPRAGEKEIKMKVPAAVVPVLKFVSFATEVDDMLGVIYKSLPPEFRPRWKDTQHELLKPSRWQQVQAIIEHSDKIPPEVLWMNLQDELFIDWLFGVIGQEGAATSRNLNRMYGSGLNTVQLNFANSIFDAEHAERNRVDGEN